MSLHIKNREAFRRARRRQARWAAGIFFVCAVSQGAMAVCRVMERGFAAGVILAAGSAVFYLLTCSAWRNACR